MSSYYRSILNTLTVPFTNTKSILLDGVDDYVDCGTNLALLGSACTFSAWVKMTDATSFRILHKGIAASREYAFGMGTSDTLFFILYNGSTKYIGQVSTSTMTSYQGGWIHICATYDGSTNASGIKLYVNGSVFGSSAAIAGSYTAPSGNANGDVYIGRYNIEYADGNIDEVAVFNSELSASDVTAIYGTGVPNDLSSLSPVSWWRCGDGDTAPTIIDHGSGGNNGTMTNFSTFSTDVPVELFSRKSIELDGVDDFVTMGDVLNMANDGSDAFSISFWVKTSNGSNIQRFVSKITSGADGYGIYQNGNIIYMLIGSYLNNCIFNSYNFPQLNNNTWHHIVWTYDGSQSASGMKLYINGGTTVLPGGTTNLPINSVTTTTDFRIGARNQLGTMDEIAFFNSALSQTDVTTIYNGGVPNDISSLSPLSWWRCGDGDTAPTLTDNGSGGNNGTMTNFSTFSTDVPT